MSVQQFSDDELDHEELLVECKAALSTFCPEYDADFADMLALTYDGSQKRLKIAKPGEIKNRTAFIRGIARHAFAEVVRNKKRHRDLLEKNGSLDAHHSPEPSPISDRNIFLDECIDLIPSRTNRLILVASYWYGMKAKEIGAEINKSEDSINQTLSKLRKDLRSCIERKMFKA